MPLTSRERRVRIEGIEEVLQARQPPQSVNWKPKPGPQTEAYRSLADILFFGGRAGAGKTFLLIGLAGTAHRKSIIFRRQFSAMLDIEAEAAKVYGAAFYQRQRRIFQLPGRSVELGAVADFGAEQKYDGRPRDLCGFDEVSQFSEKQFRHLCGWLRTSTKGQRCRIVCTGNPPESEEGEWVTRFWGAWLDPQHPNPAEPGELRWYTTVAGEDLECEGPEAVEIDGEQLRPMSRTYIPGVMVEEYRETGYATALQALPEPLRSQLLLGDFTAGKEDSALQVIPSSWVDAAMERWKYAVKPDMRMSAVGCDPARGGRDAHVIAPRYGAWFDEVVSVPGKGVQDGGTAAALCIHYRKDNCPVHVDVIGIGASVVDSLRDADVAVVPLNGSWASESTDRSGRIKFSNKRAQWHWEMREALDPDHGHSICLPPDQELRGDLCAPRWKLRGGRLAVEEKPEIKLRIGRSPDKGDACIYALAESSVVAISPSAFAAGTISFERRV